MRLAYPLSIGAILAPLCSGSPLSGDAEPLYDALCAACHGQRGAALDARLYPPLYDNPRIAAGGAILVADKMLRGLGNMYPLAHLVSDAEVVTLANHLASANGSGAPPLDEPLAAALRPDADDAPAPAE